MNKRSQFIVDNEIETNFMSGQENELQDLLSRLDFISNLKEGEIIYVNGLSKTKCNWRTSLYRTFMNVGGLWTTESKQITLKFFKETLDEAFKSIAGYIQKESLYQRSIVSMIMNGIIESRVGISNYKETCQKHGDDIFVSQLNSLDKILNVKLDNLRKRLEIIENNCNVQS